MAIQTATEKQHSLPTLTGRTNDVISARSKRDLVIKEVFAAINELPEGRRPFFSELASRLIRQTAAAWWIEPGNRETFHQGVVATLTMAKGL